jgi:hypothetical protein
MPQPKTPDYWRDRVKALLSQHGGQISDRAIFLALRDESRKLRELPSAEMKAIAGRFPSTRTIGRIRKDEWLPMKSEEKAQYRDFYWPGSMKRGDLPWEASAAALELLDVHRKEGSLARFLEKGDLPDHEPFVAHDGTVLQLPPLRPPAEGWVSTGLRWGRPSVRLVRWYWHITQATPDLPPDWEAASKLLRMASPFMVVPGRYHIAVVLAEREANPDAPGWPQDKLETFLASAPWRSLENAIRYKILVESGEIHSLTTEDLYDYEYSCHPSPGILTRQDFNREILGEILGKKLGDEGASGEATGTPEAPRPTLTYWALS